MNMNFGANSQLSASMKGDQSCAEMHKMRRNHHLTVSFS